MTDVNTHLTDRTQLADHLMRQHGVEPATLATLDTGHLRGSHQFEHDEFGPLDHDHRTGAVRSAATARAARQQLRNALVEQLNSDVYDAAWDAHVDDDLVFDPGDLTGFQLAVSFERDSAGNEYLEAQLDALLIGLIDLVPIRSSGLDGTALSFTGQAGEALTLLCRDGLIDQPGRWTIILHGDGDDQHRLVHHTDDGTDRYPMPVDLPCCGHTSASPAETDEHLPGCQY